MEEPETSKKDELSPPTRQKRVLHLSAELDREWAKKNCPSFGTDIARDTKHDHGYLENRKPHPAVAKTPPQPIRNLENTKPSESGSAITLEDVPLEPQTTPNPPRQRLSSFSGELQTLDSGVVTPQRQVVATLVPRSNSPQKVATGRVPLLNARSDLPLGRSRPGEQVRTAVFSPEAGGHVRLAGTAPLILASRGTKHSARGRTARPQNEMPPQPSTVSVVHLSRSPPRKPIEGMSQGDVTPSSMAVRLAPPVRPPEQKQISFTRSPRIMRPALPLVHRAAQSSSATPSLPAGPPGEVAAPMGNAHQKEEVLPPHIRDVAMSLQNEPFMDVAVQYRPDEMEGRDDLGPRHRQNVLLSPSLTRQRQISSSSASSLPGSARRIALPNSSPTRVPGSSPVRTNLDFNNHLKPLHHDAAPVVRSNLVSPVRSGIKSNLTTFHKPIKLEKKQRGRKAKQLDHSSSNEDELIHEEESNDVRCICGTKEEFNELGWVMCDGCSVWQHARCVGYNSKTEAHNKYFCERCDKDKIRHRPHTPEEAASYVRQLVESERKGKKKGGKVVAPRQPSPEDYVPKRHARGRKRGSDGSPSRATMSKSARQLIALSGTANHFTGPRAPPNSCAKMMVAQEEVYGLVVTAKGGILAGTAAMELFGNVGLPNEVDRSDTFNPFIFYYDGFVDKNSNLSIQQKKENQICLDARKIAQEGRFVRRCCRPNSTIRHTFDGRQANFFIVARQNIAEREEITLPFEAGFRPKDKTLCRCSGIDGANCLLEDPNFIGPGFTDPPLRPPTPPPPPQPPSPPTRKTGRTRRSTANTLDVAKTKEEKSEEESAVAVSAKRGRTKSVSSKKDSEKEEVKPEASPPKAAKVVKPKSTPQQELKEKEKEKKEAVETKETKGKPAKRSIQEPRLYVLPTDRNKESREERKIRMYEKMFNKADNKKGKRGRKRVRASPDEETSAPAEKETPKAKKEGKEPIEEQPEEKAELIETAQPPLKKRLLRRWENTAEADKPKEPEVQSPAKRRKVEKKAPEKAEQEAADILASMDNKGVRVDVDIRRFVEQLAGTLKTEDYTLPADYSKLLKQMEAKRAKEAAKLKRNSTRLQSSSSSKSKKERPPPKEKAEAIPSKVEEEPVEEKQEEPKETPASEKVRRMDLQEYKKFRNSNPNKPESSTSTRRQGFIPAFDASQTSASLPDLPLLGDTPRRGRAAADSSIRGPPTRRGQSPQVASTSSTDNSSQDPRLDHSNDHNLSIGERLKLLFKF